MKTNAMKTPVLIVLFALPCFVHGQSISKNADITRLLTNRGFSGTVLIEKNDTVIYHKSFGLANRQFNIANTNETRYHIASITKLFTSALIFQLYDMGKIDLNNPIKTYLPEYKGEGAEIVTIDQLLTHTSGIKNFEEIGSDVEVLRMPNSVDDIVKKYCSGELVFQPGTRFSYNNADYIILGKIIEKLYNKSFEQVLSEKILQPLRMQNSGMIEPDGSIIKNLANAYLWDKNANEYKNNPPLILGNYFSSGAMYSTANDMLKFSNALFHGGLLSDNALELMLQTSSVSKYWAHGLEVLSLRNKDKELKSAYRQGGCQGTNTSLNYFFDEDLTIIILANTDKTPSQEFKELNKAIAEVIINE
jgi:D-alanyl-D-alanine carboxypeptidase